MKPSLPRHLTGALLGAVSLWHAAEGLVPRQLQTIVSEWCSPTTSLCYQQHASSSGSSLRVAIPDTAAASGDYDIALQISAPTSTGWVGFSWGGTMMEAPITVAWRNGNDVVVSSRWANGRDMPTVYNDATYTILTDTAVNGTHYTLSAVCKGCSSWTRASGTKTLSPTGTIQVAWAHHTQANSVAQPANPASAFSYHNAFGYFQVNLGSARVPSAGFEAAAAMVRAPGAVPPAAPVPAPVPQPAPQPAPQPVPGQPFPGQPFPAPGQPFPGFPGFP